MPDDLFRPLHPRWWILVIGIALAGGALFVDEVVSRQLTTAPLHEPMNKWLKFILEGVLPYIIFLSILGSFPNRWRLWIGFVSPLLLSTALTHLVKFIVGRARPRAGHGPFEFRPFASGGEVESFPSGHTSGAFALMLLLGMYFPPARPVFIALAVLVGLWRIVDNHHYLSDTIAGAVIGTFAVFVCVRIFGPTFYQARRPTKTSASKS